jgi:hypothetical protein
MRTIYGDKKINLPSEFLEDVNELDESQVNHNDIYYQNAIENSSAFQRLKNKKWEFADDDWLDEDVVEF